MTDTQPETAVETPGPVEAVERGRYALYQTAGGVVIGRASGICDRCASCGCGEQQEPVDLTPAGIMRLVKEKGLSFPNPMELMKAMRHGR
jgi:hypothetical protein